MYSTQASNWFNQSVLGAKDGSARPQRTTHDDHHRGAGEDEMIITKRVKMISMVMMITLKMTS